MAERVDPRLLATFCGLFAASGLAYARLPPAAVNPGLIAFLLPTAAIAVYVLMRLLAEPGRDTAEPARRAYDAVVFRVVLFIASLHGIILVGLLGRGAVGRAGPLVPRLAPALLGAALIAVGNVLPRIRPNVAIGIRTARTLRSREAWMRVNRRAGYVAVALGSAIVLTAALVPPGPRVAVVVGAFGIGAIVTLVAWTWRDAYGRHHTGR